MQTLPSPAIARQFGPIVLSLGAPSLRPLRNRRLALALCGAILLGGCNLGDVFETPSASEIVFVWEGPTEMTAGDSVPVRITVLADGEPLVEPRLFIRVFGTTIVNLTATGDSIVALSPGRDSVVVELRSSLRTAVVGDTFEVRVTGGPPQ